MEKFNINRVIEYFKLDEEDVAEALFPHIRYKKMALDRIKRGEANIDTEQLKALADLAGVFVSDLYNCNEWKGTVENSCLTFVKGTFKAKLNYNGVYLTVYDGATVINKMMTSGNLQIDDFINLLDNIIKNYQENGLI